MALIYMRIITKARLKEFWEKPHHEGAEGPLRAWHTQVSKKATAWANWGDVKEDFRSASIVGNCVVFNIGGNKFRLITRILYRSQKVYILTVLTHKEYDLDKWKHECGCYEAPPQRGPTSKDPKKLKEK